MTEWLCKSLATYKQGILYVDGWCISFMIPLFVFQNTNGFIVR